MIYEILLLVAVILGAVGAVWFVDSATVSYIELVNRGKK